MSAISYFLMRKRVRSEGKRMIGYPLEKKGLGGNRRRGLHPFAVVLRKEGILTLTFLLMTI